MDVFVSVGTGLSSKQEVFVSAIESRLRAEGLNPCTVGRNFFSADAPLKSVGKLMDRCSGTVIVALDRYFFPQGLERPGADREQPLSDVRFPTPWNQIEAAIAYRSEHPLLVIVDNTLRTEGLLEPGNDWFVQRLEPSPEALNSVSFNGIFADWRDRVRERSSGSQTRPRAGDIHLADMTAMEMISQLKTGELWKVIVAVGALLASVFVAGTQVGRLTTSTATAPVHSEH